MSGQRGGGGCTSRHSIELEGGAPVGSELGKRPAAVGSELGHGHQFVGVQGKGEQVESAVREQETPLFSWVPSAPTSSTLPRSRVYVIVHSHSVTSHPTHPGWVDDWWVQASTSRAACTAAGAEPRGGRQHTEYTRARVHFVWRRDAWGLAESVESPACASGLSQPSDTIRKDCRANCGPPGSFDRRDRVREHRAAAHSGQDLARLGIGTHTLMARQWAGGHRSSPPSLIRGGRTWSGTPPGMARAPWQRHASWDRPPTGGTEV